MTATNNAGHRDDRRTRWAARENARRQQDYQQSLQAWQRDAAELDQIVGTARNFTGVRQSEVVLKRAESVFLELPSVRLVEVQHQAIRPIGGAAAFSLRAAKAVQGHLAGGPGTVLPGGDQLKIIDAGAVTITNQRVVLRGVRSNREWAYAKLAGISHDDRRPITLMQVTSRQKVSGLLYDPSDTPRVRFFLALALAQLNAELPGFVARLEQQRAQHQAAVPVAPTKALPSDAPGGWPVLAGGLRIVYFGRPNWPRKRRIVQGIVTVGITLLASSAVANAIQPKPAGQQRPHPIASAHPVASVTSQPTQSPAPPRPTSVAPITRAAPTSTARPRPTPVTTPKPKPSIVTVSHPPVPVPVAPAPVTSAPPSCYPLTSGGNCYEPGEFCRASDHGSSGVAGDGEKITCADNNGWRWEPAS